MIKHPLKDRRDRGIALLLVLWTVTVLMVIVFSFSSLSRTETLSASGFREVIGNKHLAEAGLERAVIEILNHRIRQQQPAEGDWTIDNTTYRIETGSGRCAVRITEETGLIDINMLTDASGIILKNLLVMRGVSQDEADTITDSLLDWKDSGDSDAHRLHGAESDYYRSLPVPYAAKNANFDTVEELLLVKGMTPEILFGGSGKKGIFDLLTVHSRSAKINISTAPKDVLASIPGIGSGRADEIIALRQAATGSLDLQSVLGQDYTAASAYIMTAGSSTYTVESLGFRDNERSGFAIKATVTFSDSSRYRYLYFKSPSRVLQ